LIFLKKLYNKNALIKSIFIILKNTMNPDSPLSKKVSWDVAVISAVIWNFFITIIKFIWFFMSWSGALFSEAIHSFADTMNQILLLVWLHRSKKDADHKFDYWYWKERFFWAIISACWIFFIWAWFTIYHWIEWLLHPHPIENIIITYIILLTAFIVEWATLIIAIKSIYKKEDWLLKSVKNADNASLAVILEDTVAVFWIIVAFIAIFLSNLTWNYIYDGIWSIIIWILLWVVAIILIIENKSLLLWKAIDIESREDIIEFIESEALIKNVVDFKSELIWVWQYAIKCEAEFNWTALMREINANWYFADEYEYIKEDYQDFLKFCVDYADRMPRLIGKNIDEIEKRIMEEFPNVTHIDIELN